MRQIEKIKNAANKYYYLCKDGYMVDAYNQLIVNDGLACTITTRIDSNNYYVLVKEKTMEKLRIRKLTPKECFRLMGVKDEDFENAAKNQSNSSLYHLAGDSIVVNVLMEIFKQMLGGNDE